MKIYNLLFALLCFTIFQSCTSQEIQSAAQEIEVATIERPEFIHTVYFWMKDDISAADHEHFKKEMIKLEKCASIQSVYWGPSVASERATVDSSYDYAWVVHFENAAGEKAYQVDPIHLAFIENCKDLWERVQVYDNLVSN